MSAEADHPEDDPVEIWHGGTILSPNSVFSREVFKIIRPHIPAHGWPVGQPVTGLFLPIPSGMALMAEFEHLSGEYRKHAEQAVLEKGVELVLESPSAPHAYSVFKAKRWRDVCLYALLPMLFTMPVFNGLFPNAIHGLMIATVADMAGLIASQLILSRTQTRLIESRFIAHIPTPGMRIRVSQKAD